MQATRQDLRDWLTITIIILIGFLLLIFAGSMAIRFSPSWELAATMSSNLDPNSDFLTNRPSGFIPAVNVAILTPPAWLNVFQTPGASVPARTPLPTLTAAPPSTSVVIPTTVDSSTATPIPTSTVWYIEASPTKVSNPVNTPTSTPNPTAVTPLNVDLQVTKDDGTTTYAAGGTLTYSVVVSNSGPNAVTGATVTDTFSSQFSSATWSCSPGAGATCASGTGNLSDAVNIPAGQSITYTVAATVSIGVNGPLTNTASVSLPANYTDLNTSNNSATDTNSPGVDLQITKYNGITLYVPGGAPIIYTIIVTNNSTFQVDNATVTDTFPIPAQISSTSWYCTPGAGAICTASGTGNINDSVNLPAGRSVTYTITANTAAGATGNLTNTATVTTPAGFVELVPGNNTTSHTDSYTATTVEIGPPDGDWLQLPPGASIDIIMVPPISTNGSNAPDMVYYERVASGTTVDMDWVKVEISSNGIDWIEVFYWGDANPDTNTNLNTLDPAFQLICATEIDNCHIDTSSLYLATTTGITIDVDARVPAGNYSWVRISSPVGGDGDASDINSIQSLNP